MSYRTETREVMVDEVTRKVIGWVSPDGRPQEVPSLVAGAGKGTCALLGDSRNDQQSNGVVGAGNIGRTKTAIHWLNWFNSLNNQPLLLTSKYAASGSQTSALDGQITSMAAILPLPEYAFIYSGVNDLSSGVTSAAAFANLSAACARLLGMGVTPVVFLETGSTALNTSGLVAALFDYNERIRSLGESNRGILVFDPTATIWDPAAAAWTATPAVAFKAGYSSDGTHYSNIGAYNVGVAFGIWFTSRVAPFESRPSTVGEMVNANNPLAYLANGMFTTTSGGGNSGTGSITSGTVPAAWTLQKGSNAGTATVITSPAGSFGNDLTLTITTSAADTVVLNQDVATGVRVGTTIGTALQAGFEIVVSGGTNLQGVNLKHEYNDGTTSYSYYDLYCQTASAGNGPQSYTAQLQSDRMIVNTSPSGWILARLEFVFSGAGGATIVVRRAKMRKRY